jgi:DNA polymerase-1
VKINIEWGGGPELDGPALLGLDVEGKQRGCRLVQIGYGETAWLYDTEDPSHLADLWHYLDDPQVHFVTHSRYDMDAVYWSFGIDLTGRIRDSYLLACLVFPGEHNPHGLKPLSTLLLDGDLEAGEKALHARFKEEFGGNQANYLERGYHELDIHDPVYEWYSAADAIYCLKLYTALKQAHDNQARNAMHVTAEVFFREQEISDIMGEASRRGMVVDRERASTLLEESKSAVAEANEKVRTLTGYPARSVKVGEWLSGRGVEFPELTPAGKPKLDKDALKILVPKYQGTEAGAVLEARQKASKNSNRVANLQNFLLYSEDDGAVHPNYKTAIAKTGRMSVTEPAVQTLKKTKKGEDPDKNLRSCFVARPGYVLIGADFDTQEMRAAAALSGDRVLADRILSGADLHALAAEAIFGPEFTKEQRDGPGKVYNFASLFGAGPKAIAKQTGMAYDAALDGLGKWWGQYPELSRWNLMNMIEARYGRGTMYYDVLNGTGGSEREIRNRLRYGDSAPGDGWVILDSGRMVPSEPDKGYTLTNTKIQGTSRDLTCQAVVTYARLMPGTLMMVVHDELLAEVPEGRVEEGLAALTEAMNFTFISEVEPNAIPMPFTATAEVLGERWVKK